MRALVLASSLLFLAACSKKESPPAPQAEPPGASSVASLTVETIDGGLKPLSEYKGKPLLIVNTASRCGYTPQLRTLQKLYETYSERGLVVLGFPSNDFGGQEPGSAEEIRKFCTDEYEITFPLFEKRQVKGEEQDEIYQLLTAELEEPTWDFTKYLVDREGKVLARFSPSTQPSDPELRDAIENALAR